LLVLILALFAGSSVIADDAMPTLDQLLETFREEFVAIHPGEEGFPAEFTFGGEGVPHADPASTVRFEGSFEIGKYEIPQNLYEAVMGDNPSQWKGPRNSVEMMTWSEAVTFCERVTELLRERELIEEDQVVRLPSEAEWEYCCRAGTDTAYSFGDEARAPGDEGNIASVLDEYGWHTGNAAGNDPPVGALMPNPWGLYDMHGYLSEFCLDDWHDSHEGAPSDGSAWRSEQESTQVVLKSGSWRDTYIDLRSRSRQPFGRADKNDAVGFRCVIE
jgi:formylglycine-generating enzyme required for sulfatase activity